MRPDCRRSAAFLRRPRASARAAATRRSRYREEAWSSSRTRADWHSNLGIVLQERLRLDEAIGGLPARDCAAAGSRQRAQQSWRAAARARASRRKPKRSTAKRSGINPEHIDAYTNLGILLNGQKRHPRGGAVLLQSDHAAAEASGGAAAARAGALRARRARQGDRAVRGVAEGGAGQCRSPDTCSPPAPARTCRRAPRTAFVESTFDSFAASFDAKLAKLQYRAPSWSRRCSRTPGVEPSKRLDVLDAGCGTGLCGPLIAPYARRLVGVDLSAKMLAHARGAERLRRAGARAS